MKKIIFCAVLVFALAILSCFVFFGKYPGYFDDCTWTEISKSEFREKMENFYGTGKIYKKADVLKYYPKNNYFLPDCNVEKDENGNSYSVIVMAEIVGCTLDLAAFDESFSGPEGNENAGNYGFGFYVCAEDSSLVKTVGYHNWWDSCVFRSGWLVLGKKDNAEAGDYEYYYIEYKN